MARIAWEHTHGVEGFTHPVTGVATLHPAIVTRHPLGDTLPSEVGKALAAGLRRGRAAWPGEPLHQRVVRASDGVGYAHVVTYIDA